MAAAGLARFDAGGRLLWANAAFRERLGVRAGDSLGSLLAAALPSGAIAGAADRLRAGQSMTLAAPPGGGRAVLIPAEGEDGELVLTLAPDGAPDGAANGAVSAPAPETSFVGLEDLLGDRAGEAERQIMQAIAVPLVVTRLADGLVMAVNQPAGLLFEVPLDGVVGCSFAKSYYADPAERDRLLAALRDGAGCVDGFETRLRRPDGSDLWAMVSARLFRFQGADAMLACISDISARKRTEQALEVQWDQTRAVLNGLGQGVMAFDRGLRLVAWNVRAAELLGLEPEFLRYHTPYAAIALRVGEGLAFGPGSGCPATEPLPSRPALSERSWECTRSDGQVVECLTRPLPDGGFVVTYTDVTERACAEERAHAARKEAEGALRDLKEAQAHLIQSEKMAALGSLVAGVAHEINTPIGIALTGASLMAERTRGIRRDFEGGTLRKPDFADFLDTAGEAAHLMLLNIDRAAQLIQSFKQIAVDQASEERRVFELGGYIDEVLRSLGVRIKRAAHTVVVDCPADLVVDGYPGALSQVLTNFVMNSIAHGYAPGQRGALRVAVRAVGDDEVELVYADDGRGIPRELHGKVFEPFFTTSRGTGGSGLGLNIVYNIATRKLKGRIALDSGPGRGTAFTLRFPRVVPADAPPA
ncbi:ATP-binding protein [Roseomonas genomospecies 6]|uniref:histidine kinase n=1 Tax=Roseomonas genomospecies 6 TaxID=214106 RepID=A0A9W7TZG2_9PROT|nr:ATP-binding protein [Roseomonas genomospecies 6]KAA0681083.1 PAS domain-containing protein [Roseomonas genomospecies 6]